MDVRIKMKMCRYSFQLRRKNINAFVHTQKQAKANENALCSLAFKQVEAQKFDTDQKKIEFENF